MTQAVKLFAEPFDKLLNTVDAKCKVTSNAAVDPLTYTLPAELNTQFQEALEEWKMAGKVRRLSAPGGAASRYHRPPTRFCCRCETQRHQ